ERSGTSAAEGFPDAPETLTGLCLRLVNELPLLKDNQRAFLHVLHTHDLLRVPRLSVVRAIVERVIDFAEFGLRLAMTECRQIDLAKLCFPSSSCHCAI